jgi:hypothetical protein
VSGSLGPLLACRVLYGLGIGFAMHAAPAYIAETSPPSVRGLLISLKVGGMKQTNLEHMTLPLITWLACDVRAHVCVYMCLHRTFIGRSMWSSPGVASACSLGAAHITQPDQAVSCNAVA